MATITLSNVSIQFPLYQGSSRSLKKSLLSIAQSRSLSQDRNRVVVRALQDVSLTIEHGDRVGLIGHNGAGKTTFLRLLTGAYEPTSGEIHVEGEVSSLLDINLGMNIDATGYENITMRGLYMGLRPKEIRALTPAIAEFTELGEFLNMPVRTYSAGMILRLAFAAATATRPEILLMDEWLVAGDSKFLDKARARIESFVQQSQILVLASHTVPILEQWCNKIIWFDGGRVRMIGEPGEVLPLYTRGA